jgi:hypothetical protein
MESSSNLFGVLGQKVETVNKQLHSSGEGIAKFMKTHKGIHSRVRNRIQRAVWYLPIMRTQGFTPAYQGDIGRLSGGFTGVAAPSGDSRSCQPSTFHKAENGPLINN